jgi:hypothetical protein
VRVVVSIAVIILFAAGWASPSCAVTPKGPLMSDDRFWELIDQTAIYASHPDQQTAALRSELDRLPAEQIAAFDAAFGRQVERAYRWDVWGAVHVAEGGASDDGFLYFRIWLVSRGRHAFMTVLGRPDDLADLNLEPGPDGVYEFEEFGYIARQALAAKEGGDPGGLPGDDTGRPVPLGTPFKQDPASLAAAYPKLWKRFGQHPLGGG